MKPRTIKLITAGLALSGTVLAVGATLTGIPGLPPWLLSSWPIIYGVALAFDRAAHAMFPEITVPAVTPLVPAPLIPSK